MAQQPRGSRSWHDCSWRDGDCCTFWGQACRGFRGASITPSNVDCLDVCDGSLAGSGAVGDQEYPPEDDAGDDR
jgi:hypothetical protein